MSFGVEMIPPDAHTPDALSTSLTSSGGFGGVTS